MMRNDYAVFVSVLVLQRLVLETGSVGTVESESEGVAEGMFVERGSCTDGVRVMNLRPAVVSSEYWSPVSSSCASSTISAQIRQMPVLAIWCTYTQ